MTISPLESVQCRDIIISIFWSTHGKGNRDKNELGRLASGPQRLIAGKDIVIPFSFQLPYTPLTYHGTYINIDYYVKAKIDLALKIDPSVEYDFLVILGETYSPSRKNYCNKNSASIKVSGNTSPLMWIVGIIILTFFTILFLHIWYVFLGVAIIFAYRPLMNKYATKKTGEITVDTGNGIIYPGKKLPVTISFTPDADLNLNCVKVTLVGEEKAVSGSGTNKTTHTHQLVNENIDLPFEKHIRKGNPVQHRIDLLIPDIAAYTFDSGDNTVTWKAVFHIGIDKWPDWKKEITLVLCPDVNIIELSPEMAQNK